MKAKTRKTDPQASHDAAKRVQPHISKQAKQVLKLFGNAKRGYTARMLEVHLDNLNKFSPNRLTRYQISRRIPDLVEVGLVEKCGHGICPVHGVSMTWWRRK